MQEKHNNIKQIKVVTCIDKTKDTMNIDPVSTSYTFHLDWNLSKDTLGALTLSHFLYWLLSFAITKK